MGTSPESMTVATVPRGADYSGNGEVVCGTSATAFPEIQGRVAWVSASSANTGVVYLGTSSGVTAVTGSTNTTAGLQLAAGEKIPVNIPKTGMSSLYVIGTHANDSVTYLAWR